MSFHKIFANITNCFQHYGQQCNLIGVIKEAMPQRYVAILFRHHAEIKRYISTSLFCFGL